MIIKTDSRQNNVTTIRCCLCTIGIGNSIIDNEWHRHYYRTPYVLRYKNKDYILDYDCYQLVLKNPSKLKKAYKLKN